MVVAILGGGQLARMLALAGLPLGLRFRCLDPSPDAVAGHTCELVVGAYEDLDALQRLVCGAQLVTFEFENVPVATAQWLQEHAIVQPTPRALAIGQDRVQEKQLFQRLGIGTPVHAPATTLAELRAAVTTVGAPCIVKTRRLGYDGRGQVRLQPGPDLDGAIAKAHGELTHGDSGGLIVERFVPFDRELSVLAVRGLDGSVLVYPVVENVHQGGILRRSRAPAPDLDPKIAQAAAEIARALLEELNYVGVLAIELFLIDGRLLANELAPRVHNSGHWTIEGSICSQFENHLRAVLGLPLGSCDMAGGGTATMVNLIGELPSRRSLLALPGVRVHGYGKSPRPGRKLGHATVVGSDRAHVDAIAAAIEALPSGGGKDWAASG